MFGSEHGRPHTRVTLNHGLSSETLPESRNPRDSIMRDGYIVESVNPVENNFSADSRDKDGMRVVMFDARRALTVYLFTAHIIQIEAVKDSKTDEERGIITLSSGLRYVTKRAALAICAGMPKLA